MLINNFNVLDIIQGKPLTVHHLDFIASKTTLQNL